MEYSSKQFLYLQKRGIVGAILLSIITCGIYAILWMIWINNELRRENNQKVDGGFMFFISLITCGIAGFYWMYRIGMDLSFASQKSAKYKVESYEAILYLVLSIFGFGLISLAIIQHKINLLCEEN